MTPQQLGPARATTTMCTPSMNADADAEAGAGSAPAATPSASPLAACSVHNWLPSFRRHALRCEVVPLPPGFLEYLSEDGLFVEPEAMPRRARVRQLDEGDDSSAYGDWSSSSSSSASDSGGVEVEGQASGDQPPRQRRASASSDDSQDSNGATGRHGLARDARPWGVRFPELQAQITSSIERLGGSVVPKLNWSCPTDAVWVNPSTMLACSNAEQVVMMLKSSDRIAHDLDLLMQQHQQQEAQQPLQQPHPSVATAPAATDLPAPATASSAPDHTALPPTLALRRWYPALRPEREFRCFVRAGRLLGACQRDISQHFPQLSASGSDDSESHDDAQDGAAGDHGGAEGGPESSALRGIRRAIHQFHSEHVGPRFPLEQYTYDLYVASDLTVKIVDFNPVGGSTSPLLFSWQELGIQVSGYGTGEDAAQAGAEGEVSGTPARPAAEGLDTSRGLQGGNVQGQATAGESRAAGAADGWALRVVPPGGGVQAGVRAACGMPYDMLALQEGVGGAGFEDMVQVMQRAAVRH